jgi:hypothetical protein
LEVGAASYFLRKSDKGMANTSAGEQKAPYRPRKLAYIQSLKKKDADTLRAEYGEDARQRRQRVGRRVRVDKMLSPTPASIVGPEKLPAAAFEQSTIDALLAP